MLALGSPSSQVCCMNGDVSVMTHANYQLEQKKEHKGPLGYHTVVRCTVSFLDIIQWAYALHPLTSSDL